MRETPSAFDPRWHRIAVAFLVLTSLLRLAQLSTMELAPDEAYYWDWSRRLALGYYDQGPMIAYVIRLTTTLFGTSEFGVRLGVWAASLGALLCCYILARRLFSPLAGLLSVLLLGLSPFLEVGSLIATYDPLLVFFWALTLVYLERALFRADPAAARSAWLGAGITTGLGFLSKHTMLLLLPCLLLFLACSPSHRFWLRRAEPYLALLLTLLLYSGVFWWNAQHHGWTFGHLLFLSKKRAGAPLRRFGEFLGSQALLLGPGLFLGALAACAESMRAGSTQSAQSARAGSTPPADRADKTRFLLCMGLPILLFFCLMTLKTKVQANWAPCAWLTPTILWAGLLAERAERSPQAARQVTRRVAAAAITGGLLTLLMIAPTLRAALGLRLPPEADLSNTTYGWRQMAARVEQIRTAMRLSGLPGEPKRLFLAANSYQFAALLAFYLPDHPPTYDLFLHFRLTMYAAHVEDLKRHLGEDALFVDDGMADDADLRQIFERVTWDPPLLIWRRPLAARPVHTLYIARCHGYRRYTGLEWAQGG